MLTKYYHKNIAEGKGFLFFSIIFCLLIRVIYFFYQSAPIETGGIGGYLWNPLIPFFENTLYSILASTTILALMAFIVNYTNTEHAFVRRRTLLPPAILLLLFSCMPSQLLMSSSYIGALTFLLIVNVLFQSYNESFKQGAAYKTSFYLSLGSLFAPVLLLYFPILWICLTKIKSFSFKALLASVLSFFIVYIPAFSYFFIVGEMNVFWEPFVSIGNVEWTDLPILEYNLPHYLILGTVFLLILIIMIYNSVNSFKDKIRVRAFIFVITLIVLFSIFCTLFLNIDTSLTLFVALAIGSLQIAHFFSLAEQKIIPILFLFYLIILIAISAVSFIS